MSGHKLMKLFKLYDIIINIKLYSYCTLLSLVTVLVPVVTSVWSEVCYKLTELYDSMTFMSYSANRGQRWRSHYSQVMNMMQTLDLVKSKKMVGNSWTVVL